MSLLDAVKKAGRCHRRLLAEHFHNHIENLEVHHL
jgi:hypothetical protein